MKEEVLSGERDEASKMAWKDEQKGPAVFPELGAVRWGWGKDRSFPPLIIHRYIKDPKLYLPSLHATVRKVLSPKC